MKQSDSFFNHLPILYIIIIFIYEFDISDGVHNVDIEPKVRDVKIGDQFTCSADSYPAPEFKWYCQDRMFLRTG